jgi:hypothetical protein
MEEIYTRVFIIIPCLIYAGVCIIRERSHTSTFLFHMIVVLLIAMVLFFHLKYILKIIKRIFSNRKYEKEFGVFLLMLAVFLMFLCAHDLYFMRRNKKSYAK